MWGGVKVRTNYGDIFRAWSATQGLETLRRRLYREPRPWYLAWSLHHHQHLLSDYHCARLLSWCTTVMELEKRSSEKRQAYMYAQQVFQVMVHSHKVGVETFQEFFRLCAAGRDLTTAFRWQQHLVETSQMFPLFHYTWLLHIAALSPNDESAEDMAEAVWEAYSARYTPLTGHDGVDDVAATHPQPSSVDETQQLHGLFKAFKLLKPKIKNIAKEELLEFIDRLPDVDCYHVGCGSWPTNSRHHVFPHLESRTTWTPPTLRRPCLRDSLLHPELVMDLEQAAFSGNVERIVALVDDYRQRVAAEKNKASSARYLAGERDVWHNFSDPASIAFRKSLVEEGGVTAELYHYLIVALSVAEPSKALRTLRRMEETNLRVLDLTRAVMLVRCEGSSKEQLKLMREQLQEMELRQRIDKDYDITREVELYWKFNYTDFFHYRNALNRVDFYRIIMGGLGPVRVQQLLLEAQAHDVSSLDEIVVFDKAFRTATVAHYRTIVGEEEVNKALDDITRHMPNLDISLVSSLHHFRDYALPEKDLIATDIPQLREKLAGYGTICLLDSSFVESSEQFLRVGQLSSIRTGCNTLTLIPYCCLEQLASTIEQSKEFISFDVALQESNKMEPFIASQRLQSLFSLFMNDNMLAKVGVLHFTECLLAHTMVTRIPGAHLLDPGNSENDHLLLVLAMIRAIAQKGAQVVLCTDDICLLKCLRDARLTDLFSGPVQVITSEPSGEKDAKEEEALGTVATQRGIQEANLKDTHFSSVLAEFQPRLDFPIHEKKHVSDEKTNLVLPEEISAGDAPELSTAWLDMLTQDGEMEDHSAVVNNTPVMSKASEKETETQTQEKLMNMYESEHAIVPVGALMAEASSVGTIFEQFDVASPDLTLDQPTESKGPPQSTGQMKNKPRRRTLLEVEAIKNRGASNRQRTRLGRRLSNMSGGHVPFNFRYRVLEVDITKTCNKSFKDAYRDGVKGKRESFKKRLHRSNLVSGVQP